MASDGGGGRSTSASSGAFTIARREPDGSGILGMTGDHTCDTRRMKQRWDTDERGRGVASAADFAPALERLLEASRKPDWVAEEPEHHLLPHVSRLCDERGWTVSAEIEEGCSYSASGCPPARTDTSFKPRATRSSAPSPRSAPTSNSVSRTAW